MCPSYVSSGKSSRFLVTIRVNKMKVLPFSSQICVMCGVCSAAENDFRSKYRQTLSFVFIWFNLLATGIAFALNTLYQLKMGNIFEILFSVLQLTPTVSLMLSYISIAYRRQNTRRFFNSLQTIFDQCKLRE